MKKVCVVGVGNMGKAILTALQSASFCEVFACQKEDDINEKLAQAQAFIIAVKPQDFQAMADPINIDLNSKVAISIMAGISIENMQNVLQMKKVARTFPNLPLKIGKAVTCWKASEELSTSEKELVLQIVESFGVSIEVEDEAAIAKIGALSACGPAYFAYLAEIMKSIAMEEGLNEEDAEKMAAMTFVGSGELLEVDGLMLNALRAKVSSKGGITVAALEKMKEAGFEEAFRAGFQAAIQRTQELNN